MQTLSKAGYYFRPGETTTFAPVKVLLPLRQKYYPRFLTPKTSNETMNRPTFFPGVQATCEDCRHFACTGYHSYHCEHKDRQAGPFDTICECYIDRRTGRSI